MSRKLYALLLPVLAIAAMAMTAGAAQAAPHWFVCEKLGTETGKLIDSECQKGTKGFWEWEKPANEKVVQVVMFGKLKFTSSTGIKFECKTLAAGNIENRAAGGLDDIEVFVNYECSSTTCTTISAIARGFNWPTELLAGPVDKIGTAAKPIEIVVNCGGTEAVFKGELSPKLVNPTESHPLSAEFTATTGTLSGPGGSTATVEGPDVNIVGFNKAETLKVE